ncbi:MAG: dimethyl sulfoxide reductase anchor subunit [Betaproteobacteria bacterium]|nr:dimethyl sulfoxide reductase anchor subunit [Betaproteobacteria bacterium]
MLSNRLQIVDDFRVGFRAQKAWGGSMATAFFFGEAGAGLFFISQFFGFVQGMAVALLMVLIGKGGGHLMHLGRPSRGWRALARIGSSWISRGLFAIAMFAVFGGLHILDVSGKVLPEGLSMLVRAVAVAACLVIMVYQGFAMSHSSSISLWSTGLMPITSLTYSLLAGTMLMLVLGYDSVLAEQPDALRMLKLAAAGLLLYGFVVILAMLHAAKYGSEGGQESVELLLKRDFAKWFVSLVILVGFVLTGLLAAFGPTSYGVMLTMAAAELTGYYAFRVLVFKAATYDPAVSFAAHFRR